MEEIKVEAAFLINFFEMDSNSTIHYVNGGVMKVLAIVAYLKDEGFSNITRFMLVRNLVVQ